MRAGPLNCDAEQVEDIRRKIPGVSISTDMISGFCGETEAEHLETLSLMDAVGFENAFCFAFSEREKTHAHRSAQMADDVPADVKRRRLNEVADERGLCLCYRQA